MLHWIELKHMLQSVNTHIIRDIRAPETVLVWKRRCVFVFIYLKWRVPCLFTVKQWFWCFLLVFAMVFADSSRIYFSACLVMGNCNDLQTGQSDWSLMHLLQRSCIKRTAGKLINNIMAKHWNVFIDESNRQMHEINSVCSPPCVQNVCMHDYKTAVAAKRLEETTLFKALNQLPLTGDACWLKL